MKDAKERKVLVERARARDGNIVPRGFSYEYAGIPASVIQGVSYVLKQNATTLTFWYTDQDGRTRYMQ